MTNPNKWLWFANDQVHHYQSDVEPKLYPDAYTKFIEAAPALAEIERLKAENEKNVDLVRYSKTMIDAHISHSTNLTNQLAEVREVIAFYGDEKNWEYWHNHDVGAHKEWNTFRPEVDCGGKRARAYLKANGEG